VLRWHYGAASDTESGGIRRTPDASRRGMRAGFRAAFGVRGIPALWLRLPTTESQLILAPVASGRRRKYCDAAELMSIGTAPSSTALLSIVPRIQVGLANVLNRGVETPAILVREGLSVRWTCRRIAVQLMLLARCRGIYGDLVVVG
jgi:hypothetical protein